MELQHENYVHIDLAHRERRRADKLLKANRFEEAISAHQDAIGQLEKVLALAKDPVVHESIQLQIAFHSRQQLIVAYKRERQKSLLKPQPSLCYSRSRGEVIEAAEMALPDPMDMAESKSNQMHILLNHNVELLQRLLKRSRDSATLVYDSQVIDELRANNTELQKLLDGITSDNRTLRQQNQDLRDEVEFLRSRLNQAEQPRIIIPELAPLEKPDFDNFEN